MCGFPTTCLEIQLLTLVGLDVVVNKAQAVERRNLVMEPHGETREASV